MKELLFVVGRRPGSLFTFVTEQPLGVVLGFALPEDAVKYCCDRCEDIGHSYGTRQGRAGETEIFSFDIPAVGL